MKKVDKNHALCKYWKERYSRNIIFMQIFSLRKKYLNLIISMLFPLSVKLEILQDNWLNLIEATKKFAEFYNFIMIGCVFKLFFSILTDLYSIIKPILTKNEFETPYDILMLCYLFYDLFLLITMTYFVTKLMEEVGKYRRVSIKKLF